MLLRPVGISGGIGSSSLKECIELLNATERNSPAPLDSGISHEPLIRRRKAASLSQSFFCSV